MRNNNQSEYEKYLKYSIKLCNRYIYTSYKLRNKLESKNVSKSTINKILITINKYSLINDRLLIRSLIEEMISNYYGYQRIKDRLFKMKFNEDDIKSCLSCINKDKINIKLKEYINHKCPKEFTSFNKKVNFIKHCQRRGYDINDINCYL